MSNATAGDTVVHGGVSPTMILATAVGGLAIFIYIRNKLRSAPFLRALKSLPTPDDSWNLPYFGHALTLAMNTPWDIMERWVRKNDGKMILVEFMNRYGVVVTDPVLLKKVLDKNQRNYAKDVEFGYSSFMDILGTGLITSNGDKWTKQRYLVSRAFRIEILEETADVAKRAVDRLSTRLNRHCEDQTPVELAEEYRIMTLQVIGELILSLTPEESQRVFPDLYLPIVTEANLRVWEPWRPYIPTPAQFRYHKTVAGLNAYVSNLIRERWAKRVEEEKNPRVLKEGEKPPRKDILDLILSDLDPAEWSEAIVVQLRDEIKSFLLAGHETTATMLTWATYMMTQHPECLATLRQEGKSIFGAGTAKPKNGLDEFQSLDMPSNDDLKNLTYTVNCLRETLRYYTPVPVVTRDVVADDDLGDITIPAGAKIFINIKAVHQNPALWEKPEQYDPTRFDRPYDPYAFLAFLNGPRNCLGQHLALIEARIVLSLLMQRFEFTPIDSRQGEVHPFMVPVCPKNGLNLNVKRYTA